VSSKVPGEAPLSRHNEIGLQYKEENFRMPKRLWIAMVILGACARLAPHPWNFAPIMAMALFAGAQARKTGTGVLVTVAALALSDAVLGFYQGIVWVYVASLVPVFLGRLIQDHENNHPGVKSIGLAALASSLSFFAITNFAVWAGGQMYPHTAAGLTTCFVAAIPFFKNQIMGDAFYTVALFGGFALLRTWLEPARAQQAA
jgi:hypothetical protein